MTSPARSGPGRAVREGEVSLDAIALTSNGWPDGMLMLGGQLLTFVVLALSLLLYWLGWVKKNGWHPPPWQPQPPTRKRKRRKPLPVKRPPRRRKRARKGRKP